MGRRRRNKNLKLWATKFVPRPTPVYGESNLGHVVLLGDSIFDNENYVDGHPDVAQRLHSMLGEDYKVTLLASDGATTGSLGWQVEGLPGDATHLVLSIGGNDANGEWKILRNEELRTARDVLDDVSYMGELFAVKYWDAVVPLLGLGIPVTICTIYDCDFPEDVKYPARAALAMFNDAILRFAFQNNLDVLDLRTVCTEPSDYVLAIEPSAVGGAKIARAISQKITIQ